MTNTRYILESRAAEILSYLHHEPDFDAKKQLQLFSLTELTQIVEFLESGDMSIFSQLLQEKVDEYEAIAEEISRLRIKNRVEIARDQEAQEEPENELLLLSAFD